MKHDKLRPKILATRTIASVSSALVTTLNLPQGHKSIGLISADMDDVTYTALDEATKAANVKVVYAKSMYAGAANASTALQGEVIGIISGPSPAEVKSGLDATIKFMENDGYFLSATDDDSICYYAHTVSRTGSYLSEFAGIKEGEPLAYLIAPPLEAMYGLDAALKASDVKIVQIFEPPSETNFGGGLLTGTQSACKSACDAFSKAVLSIAEHPKEV